MPFVKNNFRESCPKELFPILMVLESVSDNNYVVGGAVRDLLTGKTPNDYDVVTDTPMEELEKLFLNCGFAVTKTGVSHFVLNVHFSGYEVEVSNFRKDKVCNGRQAEVEVGTILDDTLRRDFTVNAVYMHTRTMEIVDLTGQGCQDAKDKVLRFVGNPKDRIREDYLRVWRAFRLQRTGFTFEKKTERALREMFKEAYENSNPQRVLQEMIKLSHQ